MAVKPTTIVSLPLAREWCIQDATNTTRDASISLAADAASERIERDTSRVFKRRTLTETHSGDGVASTIYTNRFPILSVASITVDGIALDATFYVVDGARGRIRLLDGRRFSSGVENIALDYDAGYEDADLPSDVVELALQLTARIFKMRSKGGSTFETVNVGPNSFTVRDNLPSDFVKAIERLRDKRFG